MPEKRPLESQLAPGYNAFLKSHPHDPDQPQTSERSQRLFEDAVAGRVSDIHIDPQEKSYRVRFRVDGALHDVASLEPESGRRMLRYLRTMAKLEQPKPFESQGGRIHLEIVGQPWEMRLSTAPVAFGEKAALRLLSKLQLQKLISELGMSPHTLGLIQDWMDDSSGMLIVAGPTGCGKTTTLYALLHEFKMRQRSVVTIEDPVEYAIEGITQIEVHESNGLGFVEGLKIMLRLDPDYMLLGEIRDRESATTAIDAAGAGRILMTTLHSRDAASAVTMLRNYGLEDHEIAATLEMIVAQRLVRKLCEHCREIGQPTESESRWLTRIGISPPRKSWHAGQCDQCSRTGFHGRLGVFEVWRLSERCRNNIIDHADEIRLRHELISLGQPLLLQDGLTKAAAGETTLSELQGMGAGVQASVVAPFSGGESS